MLEPTRIYAKILGKLFQRFPIKGAAHITGAGIPGNLPRVLPRGARAYLERGSWPVPAIFDLIRKTGRISQAEMERTFNLGLGMILVVGQKQADSVMRWLQRNRAQSYLVGEIRKGARSAKIF